jgi:signal peptidase I
LLCNDAEPKRLHRRRQQQPHKVYQSAEKDYYRMKQTDLDTERLESRMLRKKEYRNREVRNWFLSLAIAVVIALTVRFFVFEFIRVDGESMYPTLFTNEYVFMEKVTYWFSEPKRGDIIICSYPGHTDTYVKRVIGIEGDEIAVKDGVLYLNGEANYDYFTDKMDKEVSPFIVPENHVYVMGDNRNASMDSRDNSVGALPDSMVQGKAVFVIWPLNQMHGLYPSS